MDLTYMLQAQEVTEKALETSPYNAVAYGVLVALLILALVFLWREYKNVLERHRDYVEKTVGLIQVVEGEIDSIEDMQKDVKDMESEIGDLKERIAKLSEYVNLIRGHESG